MIRLRTLGALDLRDAEGQECRSLLAQPKRVALLVYLALAAPRGPHRRDALLAAFWPELDAERARNALSQAVHFIRRALGPEVLLNHNGDELSLAPAAVWCDAITFEDALASARPEDALDLYRGDLLEGFHVGNAAPFEQWLETERSRLALRYVQAVEATAVERERAGDQAAALALWRRLAVRDPLNDRVALRYLRALVGIGDRAGALQHARVHELLLREELDVAPSTELTTFIEALRAVPSTAPAVTAAITTPPAVPAPFPLSVDRPTAPVASPVDAHPPARRRTAIFVAAIAAISAIVVVGIQSARARPTSRELYLRELIIRGKHAELSRSAVGMRTAKEAYERAMREDSTYAPAFAALSELYSTNVRYGYGATRPARDSARLLAQRAVALDSTLPEARTALAITLADALAFEDAEREFKAAIAYGPEDAQAHYWYAMLLVVMGKGPAALVEARRALKLERFPARGMIITLRAAEYVATGERPFMKEPAGTRWDAFLKAEPGEPWAHRANAFDLAEAGLCDAARAEIAETSKLAPGQTQTLIAIAMVEWWCGDRARARAQLAQAKQTPQAKAQAPHFASAHATWGEIDSAFVWLDRADWRLGTLMDLRASRWLDPVRSDPRYGQLLREIGVPVTVQK